MSSGGFRDGEHLHVLTITPFYPRTGNDSAGCFIAEPLREMVAQDMQSTVFAVEPIYRPRRQPAVSVPRARWFRYPAVPGNRGLASAGIGLAVRLRGAVRTLHARTRIDLIHAHGALPCGHAALRLARSLGVPYVITVHGRDAFSTVQVDGDAGTECARVSRGVYSAARRVIGVSQHVCDEVRAGMGDGLDCRVVYNGADVSLFAPASSEEPLRLLTVGNLIPIKGHATVLQAVAGLLPDFPGLTWEVIGEGAEEVPLRRRAVELGIAQSVNLRGRQDRGAVAEAYRRCAVFVLPSHYEGLGCVYLEAMSAGKVAIGCTGQGIEEVIRHGETGWLVPRDGVTDLLAALRTLLRDEGLRKRIGTAAREQIVRSFTLRHQADRLLAIYRECVE